MKGADGQEYYVMMTGRILLSVAAAIRGVNTRNHGVAEP
jgi:hypothetical protein